MIDYKHLLDRGKPYLSMSFILDIARYVENKRIKMKNKNFIAFIEIKEIKK
jgi:hypothetical protein